MPDIKEILVPVDFSKCSADIVRQAADTALHHGAELVLLYVVEPMRDLDMNDSVELSCDDSPPHEASIEAHLRLFASERFPELSRVAEERGVPCTCTMVQGAAPDAIIAAADRRGSGMIVMGTHGRRGPAHVIMGSVAAAVVQRASCPVMTLRFQLKPDCGETSCMWCESGVTGLRRAIEGVAEPRERAAAPKTKNDG